MAQPTVVVLTGLPARVKNPNAWLTVSAIVWAPAGTPTGECEFDRVAGRPNGAAVTPVKNGVCRATFRARFKGSLRVRVSYLPDLGWLGAPVTSARIRVGR